MYNASLVLVKISIVLMYRRIFVSKAMKRATFVILVFLVMWGIALVSFLAMICLPIQALWDPTVQGQCMPFVPAFFAPACINMVTDFTIFLLPRTYLLVCGVLRVGEKSRQRYEPVAARVVLGAFPLTRSLVPALRKLQLPMKQKIILSFILCLGLLYVGPCNRGSKSH